MTSAVRSKPQSPTDDFFRELATQGRQPLLARVRGTVRFDIAGDERVEHWFVTIHDGDVEVSRKAGHADAVGRVDRRTFDLLVEGATNATAALLRGDVVIEGDLRLMLMFQRLFARPVLRAEPVEEAEAVPDG